jgi:hypothetical protein
MSLVEFCHKSRWQSQALLHQGRNSLAGSSVAERLTVNQKVEGSNPSRPVPISSVLRHDT